LEVVGLRVGDEVWNLGFGIWDLIPHNWGGVLKIYKIENPSAFNFQTDLVGYLILLFYNHLFRD